MVGLIHNAQSQLKLSLLLQDLIVSMQQMQRVVPKKGQSFYVAEYIDDPAAGKIKDTGTVVD